MRELAVLSNQRRRSKSLTGTGHSKVGPTVQASRERLPAEVCMHVPPITELTLPHFCGLAYHQACCTALQTYWHCLQQQTNPLLCHALLQALRDITQCRDTLKGLHLDVQSLGKRPDRGEAAGFESLFVQVWSIRNAV